MHDLLEYERRGDEDVDCWGTSPGAHSFKLTSLYTHGARDGCITRDLEVTGHVAVTSKHRPNYPHHVHKVGVCIFTMYFKAITMKGVHKDLIQIYESGTVFYSLISSRISY